MLTEIDASSLQYIIFNLRQRDKREIYNIRPHDNPIILAAEAWHVLSTMGRGRIGWNDGKPAGVLGFFEQWPGMWEAVSFGTDAYRSVAIELGRYGKQEAGRILKDVGGRRLQADVHIDNEDGKKFIALLGGREESVLRAYGKDGADYIRFAWYAERDAERIAKVRQEEIVDVLRV